MNSEEGHKIRNLLHILLQLPNYITDESDEDFDLDLVVKLAKLSITQIDEYTTYLRTEATNE
ncbi:hypothetical protein KAR91_26825 [Candidatus Pacearchaeota archaeon]|nr:hypothetical protein [Candidatus Pacearchaeota archaeon]